LSLVNAGIESLVLALEVESPLCRRAGYADVSWFMECSACLRACFEHRMSA
jgi:hypothetical protein